MGSLYTKKRLFLFSETTFVGDYQIQHLVECGTYSVLFAGTQGRTSQPVLLRYWLTAHATSSEERARLREEVAAFQAVHHPHLLPLVDLCLDEEPGISLVSAAFSETTLGTRLAHAFLQPLPLEEALSLLESIGQALEALHQNQLVHGNLTPHGILVREPQQVQVGEYRLPTLLACLPHYQPALEEGLPRCWYMAPEQFSGVVDALTDQYSLGCLAYHLLTGRLPFAGSDRATLWHKHADEHPRALTERNPLLPEAVSQVVLKALAKQPARRYRSIRAFLDALQKASPNMGDALA